MRTYQAGGNITPCSFVKSNAVDDQVILCAASSDHPVGISQEGTDQAPVNNASTYAATSGEPIGVHTPNEPGGDEVVLLFAGSGGWTAGNILVSDASGYGVPASSGITFKNIQWVGAEAKEAVTAGLKGQVYPVNYPYRASLS